MKLTLMQHQQAGSVPAPGKTYLWNGELESDVMGSYTHLRAKTIETDLKGLVKLIKSLDGNSHLVAGVSTFGEIDVMPVGMGIDGKTTIPRTNESFPFPVGEHGLMTIDSDGMGGPLVWQQIIDACPLLAGSARVEASSSGSNIYAPDGTQLRGERGQHTYLHAAEASDIPRALVALHKRLVLSGYAVYKLSAVGAILERSAVDQQLRVPSQPIYIHPTLYGVTQKKRVEFFPGNEVVDTRVAIPDLTPEEHYAFAKHDAIARAALKDEAEEAAEAYDEARGKTLPGGAAEARLARESGHLPNDWPITLSDGNVVTVADILADPKEYHGKTCRDPLEPDYGGKTVAKIYSDQETPLINSWAHGGRTLHLGVVNVLSLFDTPEETEGPRPLMKSWVRIPFPTACLPPLMAGAVTDVQYFVRAPMALVVGSAFAAMSAVAMGHVDAMRSEKLVGPSSLFLLEGGGSGERKTACDSWFTAPIADFEQAAREAHKLNFAKYEGNFSVWDVKEKAAKKGLTDALKGAAVVDGSMSNDLTSPAAAENQYWEFLNKNPRPKVPVCARMLYDVPTAERLYQALGGYPLMAILSDEGGSFAGSRAMSAESMTATMSVINKGWDGKPVIKDTKGDADYCANPRITMHLMMQHGILNDMLSAGNGKARDMGWVARFLMCDPVSTKGTRFYREDGSTFAIDLFNRRIGALLSRPLQIDNDTLVTRPLPPSPAAKAAWVAYHDKIEREVGPGGRYEGLADVASKSAENAARIACIFTYFSDETEVTEATMVNACAIAEWYLVETLTYFGLKAEPQSVTDAYAIENWIVEQCVKDKSDHVTLRQLTTGGPTMARKKYEERRTAALNALLSHARLSIKPGARESTKLIPHPEVVVDAMEKLMMVGK